MENNVKKAESDAFMPYNKEPSAARVSRKWREHGFRNAAAIKGDPRTTGRAASHRKRYQVWHYLSSSPPKMFAICYRDIVILTCTVTCTFSTRTTKTQNNICRILNNAQLQYTSDTNRTRYFTYSMMKEHGQTNRQT